jgi:hypothetical protein
MCHFYILQPEFLFMIGPVKIYNLEPTFTGSTIQSALHGAINNRPIKYVSYTHSFIILICVSEI